MDPVRIGRLTFTPPSDNTYNQHIDTDQNLRADINHQEDLARAKTACDQILAGKGEGDKLFIQSFTTTTQSLEKEVADIGHSWNQVCVLNIDPQVDFVMGIEERSRALELASAVSLWARSKGALILGTRDHHPGNHVSFASTHQAAPNSLRSMPRSDANAHILDRERRDAQDVPKDVQEVVQAHCIEGTSGAEIHSAFDKRVCHHFEPKGMDPHSDTGSCILDVYGQEASRVSQILQANRIQTVVVTGLLSDFCVGNSAMDLAANNYNVIVPEATTAPYFSNGLKTMEDSFKEFKRGKRRDFIGHSSINIKKVDFSRFPVRSAENVRLKVLSKDSSDKNYKLYAGIFALIAFNLFVAYQIFKGTKK